MCGISYVLLTLSVFVGESTCFWDVGTTTVSFLETDQTPRQSFFRWEATISEMWYSTLWTSTSVLQASIRRKKLGTTCGISVDMIPLGTAVVLNRRTLITAANFLEPYGTRQKDLRIWCLGRQGEHTTPYRYRVWRVRRILPKSNNPEHWHGPTGEHVPRHDIAIIHSRDQIYLNTYSKRYLYPIRAKLTGKHDLLDGEEKALWIAGSGFVNPKHIRENYYIKRAGLRNDDVVDCSKYLPKWWGKYICLVNRMHVSGVQNGGGLFYSTYSDNILVGLGCFEIRFNEERIFAFTDLRYYVDWITMYANITPGDYYEYAYPKWFIRVGSSIGWDSNSNTPYIPSWSINYDIFPLGKK